MSKSESPPLESLNSCVGGGSGGRHTTEHQMVTLFNIIKEKTDRFENDSQESETSFLKR